MALTLKALCAALVTALFATTASAIPTYDMIWSSTNGAGTGVGTDTLTGVAVGDTVTLDLFLTADVEGVSSYAVSVSWDATLANSNWTFVGGFPFNVPLSPGTVVGTELQTVAEACLFCPGLGLTSGNVHYIGSLEFVVNGDGTVSFFEQPGIDGTFDIAGAQQAPIFNGATLNLAQGGGGPAVPEPTAAMLFSLGLLVVGMSVYCRHRAEPRNRWGK